MRKFLELSFYCSGLTVATFAVLLLSFKISDFANNAAFTNDWQYWTLNHIVALLPVFILPIFFLTFAYFLDSSIASGILLFVAIIAIPLLYASFFNFSECVDADALSHAEEISLAFHSFVALSLDTELISECRAQNLSLTYLGLFSLAIVISLTYKTFE